MAGRRRTIGDHNSGLLTNSIAHLDVIGSVANLHQ